MVEAEGDVGGGLNDGIQKCMNGVVFEGDQMVPANGHLEPVE